MFFFCFGEDASVNVTTHLPGLLTVELALLWDTEGKVC